LLIQAKVRRGLVGELAGVVSGVGPDQADATAGAVGVPQQRPGRVAVLDGRGGDRHVQDQAGDVDGDVALAAIDLLGVIPAPAGLRHRVGRAHGLGSQ
jgi:hypothetical protein